MIYLTGWREKKSFTRYPGEISVFFKKQFTILRKSRIRVRCQRTQSSNKKRVNANEERPSE